MPTISPTTLKVIAHRFNASAQDIIDWLNFADDSGVRTTAYVAALRELEEAAKEAGKDNLAGDFAALRERIETEVD